MPDVRTRRAFTPAARRGVTAAVIAAVLLAPSIAMRFTTEVRWTGSDVATAGALLVGAAVIHEIAVARAPAGRGRRLVEAGLLLAVALVWAQGAVGIV